ncbi:MAG: hypothetical protein BGO59_07345 [Spirosoma sp. 48-14]|nr:MAG: hypothetical protein BGO59_07345 [Spirosoma sp. 48-14]
MAEALLITNLFLDFCLAFFVLPTKEESYFSLPIDESKWRFLLRRKDKTPLGLVVNIQTGPDTI